MSLVSVYRVTYKYSANQAKHDNFTDLVTAAANAGEATLASAIKSQLPKGSANVQILSIETVFTNVIQ